MTKTPPIVWLFVGVAATAALGGGVWWSQRSEDPGAVPPSALVPAAPAVPTPGPTPVAEPVVRDDDPKSRIIPILYPDGSRMPPLNGVKVAPSLYWPPEVPFTPVVGTFVDAQGIEWYKHADGSQSTTQMVWRKDLGREDAVSRVAAPTTPLPMLLEDADGSSRLIPVPKPTTPPAQGGAPRKS